MDPVGRASVPVGRASVPAIGPSSVKYLWERPPGRDLIDLNTNTLSNRNQRLLLHDLYQLTAFL